MHRLGGQTAPISGGDVGVGGATAERFAARALKRLTALLVSLLLAACATPVAVLAPVAQGTVPPNASQVSMLIATSRQPSGDPGTLFSGERGRQLSLAAVDVSIPPDTTRQSGTVPIPARISQSLVSRQCRFRRCVNGFTRILTRVVFWSLSMGSTTALQTPCSVLPRSLMTPVQTLRRSFSPGRRAAACSIMSTTGRVRIIPALLWNAGSRRLSQTLMSKT